MCKCIDRVNRELAKRNTKVEVILSVDASLLIGIRTSKVDELRRGKPVTLLATFCPMCGKKLRP